MLWGIQADLRAELKDLADQQAKLAAKQEKGQAEVLKAISRLATREDNSIFPPKKASPLRFARSPSSFPDAATFPSWATGTLPWPQKLEPMLKPSCRSPAFAASPVQYKMSEVGAQETIDESYHDSSCASSENLPLALGAEAAHRCGVCLNSKVTSSLLISNTPQPLLLSGFSKLLFESFLIH